MLWDGEDYSKADGLLIPQHLAEDFNLAIEYELFNGNVNDIYIVANSAQTDSDVAVIYNTINMVRNSDLNSKVSFIEKVNYFLKEKNYRDGICYIDEYRYSGIVDKKLLSNFREVFFVLDYLRKELINNFPMSSKKHWVEDKLCLEISLNEYFSSSKAFYESCPIKVLVINIISSANKLFEHFNSLNRYKRLAFYSAYFFYICDYHKKSGDITSATVFLHRAVETLYISWLDEIKEIHIDKDGEVFKDNHRFLKNYAAMVKDKLSLSDEELEAVDRLNKLRNRSKYAHGYFHVEEERFNEIYLEFNSRLKSDNNFSEALYLINNIFNVDIHPYNSSCDYLLSNSYIEKIY